MTECNYVYSTECNFVEASNLNNPQFRINEINEINDYVIAEIKERELISTILASILLLLIILINP